VDRGDGKGFGFLAVDTVPDYVDTAPIPPAAATWKYKVIYRLHDEQVGQWSAFVSLAVGGEVRFNPMFRSLYIQTKPQLCFS
jgi:hypothetical protein